MANSSRSKPARPEKPYPDFPLFPHATKRWAKKVRGRLHYFGPWSDPHAALSKWLDQRDDLLAGRTPRTAADGLTVRELCNRFCTVKEQAADAGELTRRMFDDYHAVCEILIESFGRNRLVLDLAADDFEALRVKLAKRYTGHGLANRIQRVRSVFKYAYDAHLIERPVRFGPGFKPPAKRVLRAQKQSKPKKMFTAKECVSILAACSPQLKAMALLGLNAGFGNHDVGTLPLSALDLNGRWLEYPRPKTAVERRVPLWPETVEALREAIATRPTPKSEEHAGLVFITKYGGPWAKDTPDSPVSREFRKVLDSLGLHKPGLGFYTLRHVFQTVAGECRDPDAVRAIMGHVDDSMSAVYREGISDARLRECVNTVRRWLFPKVKKMAK